MQVEDYFASIMENAELVYYENATNYARAAWKNALDNAEDRIPDHAELKVSPIGSAIALAENLTVTMALPSLKILQTGGGVGTKTMLFDTSDIISINPKGIHDFVSALTQMIATAASKDDSYCMKACYKIANGDFLPKWKARIVVAKWSPYQKDAQLMQMTPVPVVLDAARIQKTIIPMLSNFAYRDADPGNKARGYRVIYKELKDTKTVEDNNIDALLDSIDDLKVSDANKIALKHLASSLYILLIKYTIAATMRLITLNCRNVQAIYEALGSVNIARMESVEEFFEAVDKEDEIEVIKERTCGVIDQMCCDYRGMNVAPTEAYYTEIFTLPIQACELYNIKLIKYLNHLSHSMEPESAIANRCELDSAKFWDVIQGKGLSSESLLKDCKYARTCLFSDIKEIRLAMDKIPTAIESCLKTVSEIRDKVQNEVGACSEENKAAALARLSEIEEGLEDAKKSVIRALALRAKSINTAEVKLHGLTVNDDIALQDTSNFLGNAFRMNYDIAVESAEENLNELNEHYRTLYNLKLAGVYMEAEGDNNGGNQNTNQNGGNPQGNTNQQQNGEQNNAGDKPKVEDNTNNQNNGNNQGNNDGGNKEAMSKKLRDAITKIIKQVRDFIEGKGKVNLESLNKHRNYLMTRSYANVSVDVVPYQKRNYADMIGKFVQAATNITDENLRSMNEEQVRNAIFAGVSFSSAQVENKDDPLKDQLECAIAVGASSRKTRKYINGEVQVLVNDMIAFVESYYSPNGAVKAIENVKLDALDQLNNKKGEDKEGDRTNANVTYIQKCLTSAILATKNVMRDRCNDYMVVLKDLWSGDNQNKGETNNQGNNGGNQQGNGQNNDQNTNEGNNNGDNNAV